jgi:hypothetical protein
MYVLGIVAVQAGHKVLMVVGLNFSDLQGILY